MLQRGPQGPPAREGTVADDTVVRAAPVSQLSLSVGSLALSHPSVASGRNVNHRAPSCLAIMSTGVSTAQGQSEPSLEFEMESLFLT